MNPQVSSNSWTGLERVSENGRYFPRGKSEHHQECTGMMWAGVPQGKP